MQAFAEARAGEYASVGDVAEEAFRLLQRRDERRKQARRELAEVFREMDEGNFLEPADDEFATAVHERALKHIAG